MPDPNFEPRAKEDPQYQEGLREVAEGVAKFAEVAVRGIGDPSRLTPWLMPRNEQEIQVHQDAEGTYVSNHDRAAHLQEFGSVNNPPHAPLRRAAKAAGLRFEDAQR